MSLETTHNDSQRARRGRPLERSWDPILGNAGTIVSFRTGSEDAEILAKEFYPEFVNLPNYNVYLKLMVEGTVPRPFSAKTLESPD